MSDAEIEELARSGKKIAAIKAYRERHRCGLKEAKDAIDGFLHGGPVLAPLRRTDLNQSATSGQIDALIRGGQKIEAIKLYRELHGDGLKESKEAVEARARDLGIAGKSGCMALPLGLLAVVSLWVALIMGHR